MSLRSLSPLSEGEIVSGDEEKAIVTSTTKTKDGKVNMSARLHSGSSSRAAQLDGMMSRDPHARVSNGGTEEPRERSRPPYRRDRARSRSPYRIDKASSGEKRRHEDDHYSHRATSDSRRFKKYYENEVPMRSSDHRSRRPYSDLDRPEAPKGPLFYDDREYRHREQPSEPRRDRGRDRGRSRSPFRHSRANSASASHNASPGRSDASQNVFSKTSFGEQSPESKRDAKTSCNESEFTPQATSSKHNTKIKMSLSQQSKSKDNIATQDRSGNAAKVASELANGKTSPFGKQAEENDDPLQQQLSEAELIEQRRKRREAIKARHRDNQDLRVQTLEHNMTSTPGTPVHDSSGIQSEQQSLPSTMQSPQTPQRDSPPDSPAAFAVNNDEELADRRIVDGAANDDEGPSAADYDPNLDMQEDRPDHKRKDAPESHNGNDEPQQQVDEAPKQIKEFDMFAEDDDDDDDDDMFAPANSTAKPVISGATKAKALDESLLDNWDYPDGHYRIILGELLDNRYAVQQQIGKGTFATVVRALDTRTGNAVAVKIACNNETMYKAGQKEMDMLRLLNQNDQDDKKHIIRLLHNFDHKGHLCLVFENLSADLREVLKKFGRNVGLNLKAIRSYAQQMFLSLGHMRKCQILHADLKPDNILVSEKRSVIKICDLGTAAFADDAEVTPYLVSRFYRAPEVILGMPFDYAIDMWSIGCTLFELYTGRILFAGGDNNQMLRAIQECRGKFPIRMLKRSTLADKHFDAEANFISQERDKITGAAVMRQINFNKTTPGKDLRSRLSGNTKGMKSDEIKEHAAFVDLMEKCLQLDPAKRVSPNEALRHGFITHGTTQPQDKPVPAVRVAMNVPRMR